MIAMKVEIRDSKLHLSGYVNAVERDSKVITTKRGKCVEQIAAGAFAASMADGHEVRMKLNHKRDIGSTADGVLTLKEDNIGLYAEAETDDEELMTLAGKGELRGWSFGFVAKDDELESRDGKEPRRRVKALDLQEVSILSVTPAYNGTSVEVRSYEQYSDTVEAYRDDEGNITSVTVSHREGDDNGSTETTTYTDERGTATETVTRTNSYEKDAQALKNTIAQLKMKGYILEKRAEQRELEERYNHYHDPRNGRFASGAGGGMGLYYSMGKGKGAVVGATSSLAPTKDTVAAVLRQHHEEAGRIEVQIGSETYRRQAKGTLWRKGSFFEKAVAEKYERERDGLIAGTWKYSYDNKGYNPKRVKGTYYEKPFEELTGGHKRWVLDTNKKYVETPKHKSYKYTPQGEEYKGAQTSLFG